MVLSQLAASPGSGVARLIFLGHMVSDGTQGLGLILHGLCVRRVAGLNLKREFLVVTSN